MNDIRKSYLELHIAVFLFGFTAILGKWLSISAFAIVWWRVFITLISFLFIMRLDKIWKEVGRKNFIRFMLIGGIVALHWVSFYGAIKISNASITLICLATTSFMTSFIEPLVTKRRIVWYEVVLGLLILPGMYLIVQQSDQTMRLGIIIGLFSALCAAFFSVLNKKFINEASPQHITAIEMFSVWVFLTFLSPLIFWKEPNLNWWPIGNDWIFLIILALLCTTFAYLLSVRALRHLSAFASNLAINLEPVYGIALAALLLNEHQELTPSFYIGVGIILIAVFLYPILNKYNKRNV